MSVQATTWVWNHSKSGGTARLVLLALADHAHPDGTRAFPSVAELARMCGISDRTVQRTLRELEAAGEIRVVREATRYLPTEYAIPGVSRGDTRGDRLSPLNGSGVTPEAPGVTKEPSRGDTAMSPEPNNPSLRENPKNVTPARGRATPQRADADRLCEHLADRIEANGSKRPTITNQWRTAARLLLDRDGRTEAQAHAAIDWCQNDSFWRGNVMSMPKLRDKYDQLRLQAQRGNGAAPSKPSTTDARVQAGLELAAQMRAERLTAEHPPAPLRARTGGAA